MTGGEEKNWKLRLRYGKLSTPFEHYTLNADGRIFDTTKSETGSAGPAIMAMKVWASSHDEASDMITVIGKQVGFQVTGRIQLYETEPQAPPGESPHGYDIKFTPYESDQ